MNENKEEFLQHFPKIFKCTLDSKIRHFQFKLLHRILSDNNFLFKIQIRDSPLCNFCLTETDSLEHHLYLCQKVKGIWTSIFQWIREITGEIVTDSLVNVIGGTEIRTHNYKDILISKLILFTKYYIHCCKWQNKPLNFSNIKEYYKTHELVERNIALGNNSILKHYAIWEIYYS